MKGITNEKLSRDVLQRWQVPQAQVETTIAAGNSSFLPHIKQRPEAKPCEPWHSSFLKHYWPYKSRELTEYKAWERTSTNNESLKDFKVLIVHLQH